MESSTEPSIVPLSPSASSVCLTNPEPVMDKDKAAALAWYQRWQRLVDLHKQKIKILAEISELCKSQGPPDDFGVPLRFRDSFAHRYRGKAEYNGTSRELFISFLKMVFATEPEFFRFDEAKKDFALSLFTDREYRKFLAFDIIYPKDWLAVKMYLRML
ncbi:hypothetical protein OC846_005684 [Tilletia horrida]|uniref:Uncharacterized protein n=1 Tax=Tilletia horrida TaxID=155126 RepID=A0AAN6JPZ9_9BASI|nr:hypothetical protein OC845_006653 [Tilletia horrida]KAK0545394.1 hypothetical protein OC846_005684 [Tilletia horrida]KAK0559177.1 hypothetical protein OC861_006723 [Tilletia horrida]